MLSRRQFTLAALSSVAATGFSVTLAHAQSSTRVLFWFGTRTYGSEINPSLRQEIATYLNGADGGGAFNVTYQANTNAGTLARALSSATYDVLVLDITEQNVMTNSADRQAVKDFYANGRRNLMLDGSFYIRSIGHNRLTNFPGPNNSLAALTVNQVAALATRGGGILIGADHGVWQTNSNRILRELIPGARFSGETRPSTDGEFIGKELLSLKESPVPKDIFDHWNSVPNQGEAPVGSFTDFLGNPVTLFALAEAADHPGGGRRRPYISASFDPGEERTAIDSEVVEEVIPNIPTHFTPQ